MKALLVSLWLLCYSSSIKSYRFPSISRAFLNSIQCKVSYLSLLAISEFDSERDGDEARANQRLLYTIPNSPASVESVVSYIHKWGSETILGGSSIKSTNMKNGVNFAFSPSPYSYLNVYVDTGDSDVQEGGDATIFIRTSFGLLAGDAAVEVQKKKKQVHSLIKMVAQNLIESLAHDIGSLIMSMPDSPVVPELTPEEREAENLAELEREQREYDEIVQEEDEQQLRAQVYSEQQSERSEQKSEHSESQAGKGFGAAKIKVQQKGGQEDRSKEQNKQEKTRKEFSESDFKAIQESILTEQQITEGWRMEVVDEEEKEKFAQEMKERNGDNEEPIFGNDSAEFSDIQDDVSENQDLEYVNIDIEKEIREIIDRESLELTSNPTGRNVIELADQIPAQIEVQVEVQKVEVEIEIPEVINLTAENKNDIMTVYSWKNVETEEEVLVSYIQAWADKFAGRGAGIDADNIKNGVAFSFYILPGNLLSLTVSKKNSSRKSKVWDLEIKSMYTNSQEKVDEKMELLVLRAVNNLLKNLKEELKGLLLPSFPEHSTEHSEERSSGIDTRNPDDIPNDKIPPVKILESVQSPVQVPTPMSELKFGASVVDNSGTKNGIESSTKTPVTPSSSSAPNSPPAFSTSSEFAASNMKLDATSDPSERELKSAYSALQNAADTVRPQSTPSLTSSPTSSSFRNDGKFIDIKEKSVGPTQGPPPIRQRDPGVLTKAREMGVRLEKFEGMGLEEQAVRELNKMMDNSRKEGFLSYIKNYDESDKRSKAQLGAEIDDKSNSNKVGAGVVEGFDKIKVKTKEVTEIFDQNIGNTEISAISRNTEKEVDNEDGTSLPLSELFKRGSDISQTTWQEMLVRQAKMEEEEDDLSLPPTKFPIDLKAGGLSGGIDIFEGPPIYGENDGNLNAPKNSILGQMNEKRKEMNLIPPDIKNLENDERNLFVLLTELNRTDFMMHESILDSYRDFLLCDNFLFLMKQANSSTVHTYETRLMFSTLTNKAMALTAELGALVKTESVRHLQTIHDVCEIAATLQQDEDKFLERMEYVKPRFDTALIAYLQYAIADEKEGVRLRGGDPDKVPSVWMQVLTVVQNGVLAEFEARFDRLLEPLLLTIRFDGTLDRETRSSLFQRFLKLIPVTDLPYLRELATNMITRINATPINQLPDQDLHEKMFYLQCDIDDFLSEEIITQKMDEFKVTMKATQGISVTTTHRNSLIQAEIETKEEYLRLNQGSGESLLDMSSNGKNGISGLIENTGKKIKNEKDEKKSENDFKMKSKFEDVVGYKAPPPSKKNTPDDNSSLDDVRNSVSVNWMKEKASATENNVEEEEGEDDDDDNEISIDGSRKEGMAGDSQVDCDLEDAAKIEARRLQHAERMERIAAMKGKEYLIGWG